jgi:hypothetical protein
MKYTELTFTELVNKIGSSRFFDLPKMLKEVLSRLSPQEPKYKVYTALLTQSGTNAPVATVLDNTLGEVITFEYVAVGNYNIISASGIFLQNKTAFFSVNNTGGGTPPPTIYYIDENTLTIEVKEGGVSVNSFLNLTPIKIEIYE